MTATTARRLTARRTSGNLRRAIATTLLVASMPFLSGYADPASPDDLTVAAGAPITSSKGSGLADDRLQAAVDHARTGAALPRGNTARFSGERVQVEVLHTLSDAAARSLVRSAGGEVTGSNGASLVEAWVPIDQLEHLEGLPGVDYLRLPIDVNVPDVPAVPAAFSGSEGSEAVTKTAAAAWHAAGFTGQGVKVGIVDSFNGTTWTGAQGAGEVPNPADTFCRNGGATCTIWSTSATAVHGVAVAEVIHDMAPGAQLYLATAITTSDLKAAVDGFSANGVRVISRSLTALYDGPGDGTGPLAEVVDDAVAKGMVWFNSAGNSGGTAANPGAYWRGGWRDDDGDGWLEFAPGDELMGFDCNFINGFRWSDWGANRTDYDVYLLDDEAGTVQEAKGVADQTKGANPIEYVNCSKSGDGDIDYLAVKLYAANGGTAGDVLEFMTNGASVEHWQNASSATAPVVDSASPGLVAVGAVDPWNGTTIASYSSRGPTNDGRIKPDLSAVSCMSSYAYGSSCFNGTSAATPAAAGAAAVVLSRWAATTPAQMTTWLRSSAVVDRGAAGADNVFGAGELVLPAPGGATDTTPPIVEAPTHTLSLNATLGTSTVPVTVSWSASDPSGIAAYELQLSTDGGAWAKVTLPAATATSAVVSLAPGSTYRFTVAAKDGAGNWSEWALGSSFTVRDVADDSAAVAYSDGWERAAWASAFGGFLTASSTTNASATFTFTGTSVAWVASKATNRGVATVYVDGVYEGSWDLYSASTVARAMVLTGNWSSSATHTLEIRVVGTAGRPTIDIDSFVVLGGDTSASPLFGALSPARLLDSRSGGSTVDGAFAGVGVRGAGSVTELPVVGRGGVPSSGVGAVVLNVTVTQAQASGWVTVFPCGEVMPTASSVNFVVGQTVANAVVAKVGAGGKVCVYAKSAAHVLVDVSGWM